MKTKLHLGLAAAALIALAMLASAWRAARRDASNLAATIAAQKSVIDAAGNREHQRDAQLADALAAIETEKRRVQTPGQAAAKLPSLLPPLPLPITIGGSLGGLRQPSGLESPISNSTSVSEPGSSEFGPGRSSPNPTFPISNLKSDFPSKPLPSGGRSSNIPRDPSSHLKSQTSNAKSDLPSSSSLPGPPDLADSPNPSAEPALPISIPSADLKPIYDELQDCRANALESDALQKDLADEKARSTALAKERDAALTAVRGGAFWLRFKRSAKWFAIGAAAGAAAAIATHL